MCIRGIIDTCSVRNSSIDRHSLPSPLFPFFPPENATLERVFASFVLNDAMNESDRSSELVLYDTPAGEQAHSHTFPLSNLYASATPVPQLTFPFSTYPPHPSSPHTANTSLALHSALPHSYVSYLAFVTFFSSNEFEELRKCAVYLTIQSCISQYAGEKQAEFFEADYPRQITVGWCDCKRQTYPPFFC